jgi:hypothetical protein
MVIASSNQRESRPAHIRNPAFLRIRSPKAQSAPPAAPVLETLWLSAVLVAVAGALPLVMFLRG